MPHNKAFKNIVLAICILALGFSACQNTGNSKAEENVQEFAKTPYKFERELTKQADSLQKTGYYKEAIQEYELAESAFRKASNWEGLLYCFNQQAILYRRLEQFEKAHSYFVLAKTMINDELDANHMLFAQTYYYEMLRVYQSRDYPKAVALNDSAFIIYQQSKTYDSLQLKNLVRYKFYTYYRSSINYDSALKYLDLRRSFDTTINTNPRLLFTLFTDYSILYRAIGDYQRSIAFGQEAYKIALDNNGKNGITEKEVLFAQYTIATGYYKEYDLKNARFLAGEIVKNYSIFQIDDVSSLVDYLNLYAISLQGLEEFEIASEQLKRILRLFESRDNIDHNYWTVVMNLGLNYFFDGKIKEGEKLLKRALAENKKLFGDFHNNNISRYKYLGDFMETTKIPELSLAYYDSAMRSAIPSYTNLVIDLPNIINVELTYDQLLVIKEKLKAFKSVYDLNFDVTYLTSILEYSNFIHTILLENRETYEASEGKLFISENFKEMYATAIEAAYLLYEKSVDPPMKEKYLLIASQQMKRSKSILFLEQSSEYDIVKAANVTGQTKEEYFSLMSQLDALDASFFSLTDHLATSDSIRIINSARMKVNARLKIIKGLVHSSLNKNKTLAENTEHETLIQFLRKNTNTAVIEYFVEGEYIYYTLSVNEISRLFKVEYDKEFSLAFGSLLNEIANKPKATSIKLTAVSFIKNSYLVQKRLLQPILELLPSNIEHLVIIPDEFLSKLPFEVLVLSDQGTNFYTADYLIKEYAISYALSTELLVAGETNKKATKNLIGFGYSGEGDTQSRSPLGFLPGAIDEINFLKENVKGTYFLGEEGTKSKFLSLAKDYDIIHLAIHGISDSTDRYNSRLIFNGVENNVLQTKDLYMADLNSRLVILSSCESGVGEINQGEGTFSIARGFALTGTETIVMSLWQVDDRSSSKLMMDFHKGLNKNMTVGRALLESKRSYLAAADEYTSHPYYWSSFVMLGDDIKLYRKEIQWWIYLTLIVALGITTYTITKKKRAK